MSFAITLMSTMSFTIQKNGHFLTKYSSFITEGDGTLVPESEMVSEVMSELMKRLQQIAPGDIDSNDASEISSDKIIDIFEKIRSDINGKENISNFAKEKIDAELSIAMTDTSLGLSNLMALNSPNYLNSITPKTSLYYDTCAPYCVISGDGPVGTSLKNKFLEFGKAANVKFLDATQISILNEAELKFALKNCRTLMIAADKETSQERGWFSKDQPLSVLNEKSLKRILNTVVTDRSSSQNLQPIRVVALGSAVTDKKSIASILGGDVSDMNSEIVLQCKKRGFGYSLIKVGEVMSSEKAAKGARELNLAFSISDEASRKSGNNNPVLFTRSRVENPVTKSLVAAEALLRAAGYADGNYSMSVFSTDFSRDPSDDEWDDQFLKVSGPEIERVPLIFSSPLQISLRIGRIVDDLKDPKSGLITPIEVERFSNGARILFRPKISGYVSFKEEKQLVAEKEVWKDLNDKKGKSNYVSPETELQVSGKKKSENRAVKLPNFEGGLEIIVDKAPLHRVRIRRCNMGPQTIVKEESEAIILNAILRGIKILENDYRILLSEKDTGGVTR